MTVTSSEALTPVASQSLLPTRMFELTCSFVTTQLLHMAAHLRIADLLADGPRPVADLAVRAHVDRESLQRMLRALAAQGVFTEITPGTFALTPLAETLRADAPNSMRNMALMCGQAVYTGLQQLVPAVERGGVSFPDAFGTDWWSHLQAVPEEAAIFNRAMGNLARQIHTAAIAAYDLTGVSYLVDVGGGHGYLVAEILRLYPQVRATVFDQPHVAVGAQEVLQAAGVADRARALGGDFLAEVPAGGDVYVMSMTLHNWDDESAARILTNIRQAMDPEGRVLIIDPVLPEGDTYHFGKILDAVMLAVLGGRERTEAQFANLLRRAGLRHTRTVATGALTSVVEAVAH